MFGVTGHQGNHGEDVKELYYYLDSTPTHSYMKFLYKYPQKRYPYEELVRENINRGRDVPEFEILDTDCFDDDRYWDVFVEVETYQYVLHTRTHESPTYSTPKTSSRRIISTSASRLTIVGLIQRLSMSYRNFGSRIRGPGLTIIHRILLCMRQETALSRPSTTR